MIKHIDTWLLDWGEWVAGHIDRSAIGYPSQTVESRMREAAGAGRAPCHSISPEVVMPERIAMMDRMVVRAPKKLQAIAWQHYVKIDRRTSGVYYRTLNELHYWLHGAIEFNPRLQG